MYNKEIRKKEFINKLFKFSLYNGTIIYINHHKILLLVRSSSYQKYIITSRK